MQGLLVKPTVCHDHREKVDARNKRKRGSGDCILIKLHSSSRQRQKQKRCDGSFLEIHLAKPFYQWRGLSVRYIYVSRISLQQKEQGGLSYFFPFKVWTIVTMLSNLPPTQTRVSLDARSGSNYDTT